MNRIQNLLTQQQRKCISIYKFVYKWIFLQLRKKLLKHKLSATFTFAESCTNAYIYEIT